VLSTVWLRFEDISELDELLMTLLTEVAVSCVDVIISALT
jgi:hypothetical protein